MDDYLAVHWASDLVEMKVDCLVDESGFQMAEKLEKWSVDL